MSDLTEEVLASLVGSLIVKRPADREDLVSKAMVELSDRGMPLVDAVRRVKGLLALLEGIL
jgi:hypothetical protein